MTEKYHRKADGLLYDENDHFIYEGVSPLSEDEDVADGEAVDPE